MRPHTLSTRAAAAALASVVVLTACSSRTSGTPHSAPSSRPAAAGLVRPPASLSTSRQHPAIPARPSGEFTFAFAGDVNFAKRTATRLAQNPATAFGVAAGVLGKADLTMVNLETAITSR